MISTCCWIRCLALVGDRSYTPLPGRTYGGEADTHRVMRSATPGTRVKQFNYLSH